MGPNDNLEHGRRRRPRRNKKLKATFEQLLALEFDIIFDVDIELDEDSVNIRLVEFDDD